ncbi:hypothetical protein UQ82_03500 [Shigella dysenteriae]|nr:hypothetical protein UQ82_03500 [Shigella dysenteriae]
MTSLKTSIKTITYLSDTGCLEIQGASLSGDSGGQSSSLLAMRKDLCPTSPYYWGLYLAFYFRG